MLSLAPAAFPDPVVRTLQSVVVLATVGGRGCCSRRTRRRLPNFFLARGSAYIGNLLVSADRSNCRALVSLKFRGDTRNCRPRSHDNGDNHHRRDRFRQTLNYGDGSNTQKLTDSTRSDFARPKTPNCRQSTLRPPVSPKSQIFALNRNCSRGFNNNL